MKSILVSYLPDWLLIFLHKVILLVKFPKDTFKSLKRDLNKDLLVKRESIEYSQNFVFIAGLPKSGTTWIEALWSEVPGFVQYDKSLVRNFNFLHTLASPHDLSPQMFSNVPTDKYSFLKRHTHYSQENVAILDSFNIKPIVVIRDLRDMMISRYHHVMAEQAHWMHEELQNLKFDDGFVVSLGLTSKEGPLAYYNDWIKGWTGYANQHPDKVLLVKYEDLLDNICGQMENMLRFQGIDMSPQEIETIIEAQRNNYKKHASLAESLAKSPFQRNTFRKGKKQGWKDVFTDKHKAIFKQHSESILLGSGYEPTK